MGRLVLDGSWMDLKKSKETAKDDFPRPLLSARLADGSWKNINKSYIKGRTLKRMLRTMFLGILLLARRANGSWMNMNKRMETAEDDDPLFARRADGT